MLRNVLDGPASKSVYVCSHVNSTGKKRVMWLRGGFFLGNLEFALLLVEWIKCPNWLFTQWSLSLD